MSETKTQIRVTLSGCDDSTYIDMAVTRDELVAYGRLADAAEAESDYGCQPTMSVEVR